MSISKQPSCNRLRLAVLAQCLLASTLLAPVASADFAISGEWYMNRGRVMNWPAGGYDEPCPPATTRTVPLRLVFEIPVSEQVAAPCLRAQDLMFVTVGPPPYAEAGLPPSPIRIDGQIVFRRDEFDGRTCGGCAASNSARPVQSRRIRSNPSSPESCTGTRATRYEFRLPGPSPFSNAFRECR